MLRHPQNQCSSAHQHFEDVRGSGALIVDNFFKFVHLRGQVVRQLLHNRKQFVRVDNTRSETLDVTSGVPQVSLLGPLLFCIFINDLPDVLVFSDPFIFADDLKILAVKKTFWQVQNDLNGIEQWLNENKMKLAMDKCAKLSIRGQTKLRAYGD